MIRQYGGVGPLADALGYEYQRVHNWIRRGIPAFEVAMRPDIFSAVARHACECSKEAA